MYWIDLTGLRKYHEKIKTWIDKNKYVHPVNHPATMIVEDKSHRFVSDNQINNWDNKVDQTTFDDAINDIADKVIKGFIWKPPISSFDKINEYYPEPKDTWTTIAMDTNQIYIYNEETSEWQKLGSMLVPNLNFTNENPSINEVGGIGRGTIFNNVSILDILNDMFYKKVDRNNVPEFYYGAVDDPNDFDIDKYSMKQYVRFPLQLTFNDIQNKHIVFFFKPTMESGENIAPTDIFIQRISEELKDIFELDSLNIDLEKIFEFKTLNIKGTNYIIIFSKKILSGSYEFLIGRDKNRTIMMTKSLLNKINELESAIYRTKLKVEGGI